MDIINAPAGFDWTSDGPAPESFDQQFAAPVSIPDAGPSQVSDPSFTSSEYWRAKIAEFQATMDAADRVYQAVQALMFTESAIQSQEVWDSLQQSLNEYDAKKFQLRTTAEAINLGVSAVNSLGGNLNNLRLPGSLGFAPAIPLVAIAALGTAAVLTAWGREWISGVNARLKTAQLLAAQATPAARGKLAETLAKTQAAADAANGSALGALAPLVKWAAIAGVAWFAWRAFDRYSTRGNA